MSEWQHRDRPWHEYPLGTLARESWCGGYWKRVAQGWAWCNGSTFPAPGGADQVKLPK